LQADSVSTNGFKWGQVATAGIADEAVTAAKIASSVAGSGLAGGAGTALSVSVDDSTIEINSDTLRVKDGGVTSAKIADLTIVAGDIADGAITSAKILDGTIANADINASAAIAYSKLALSNSIVAGDITSAAVTNAKINNGASGDVALVSVSTSDPTGGKNGDIWVKVV
jgi:hypothetical protein